MAKAPLEKELKYSLEREEYARLRRALKKQSRPPARSETFYFEDEALSLRRSGIGLRIRIVDKRKAILTLKLPSGPSRGKLRAYRIRREYEAPLSLAEARALIKGKRKLASSRAKPLRVLAEVIAPHRLETLKVIGGMKMARVKASYEGLPFEIDRFRIFTRTFYELEIETEDPRHADKAVRELFKTQGIRYRPSALSKLGRFFAVMQQR